MLKYISISRGTIKNSKDFNYPGKRLKRDSIISEEVPDFENNPLLFEIVKANMIHEPCGRLNLN